MTPNTPMTELSETHKAWAHDFVRLRDRPSVDVHGYCSVAIGATINALLEALSQSLRAPAGEVIEALQLARDAIGTLPPFVLGGVSYDDPQTGEYAGQYPIRDEILATIDTALQSQEPK